VRREKLQGDTPLELEILGLVDDPHAAPADLLDDSILSYNEVVLGDHGKRCRQGFRQGIGQPGICRERHLPQKFVASGLSN
jgi:hypothetical protein